MVETCSHSLSPLHTTHTPGIINQTEPKCLKAIIQWKLTEHYIQIQAEHLKALSLHEVIEPWEKEICIISTIQNNYQPTTTEDQLLQYQHHFKIVTAIYTFLLTVLREVGINCRAFCKSFEISFICTYTLELTRYFILYMRYINCSYLTVYSFKNQSPLKTIAPYTCIQVYMLYQE